MAIEYTFQEYDATKCYITFKITNKLGRIKNIMVNRLKCISNDSLVSFTINANAVDLSYLDTFRREVQKSVNNLICSISIDEYHDIYDGLKSISNFDKMVKKLEKAGCKPRGGIPGPKGKYSKNSWKRIYPAGWL